MPDMLPRMRGIVKIVVDSEEEVPANCMECRFRDRHQWSEAFCVNNRQIDFLMARPDWCPIMVQGSMDELLFVFRNMSEKEKKRITERKKARRNNGK